MIHFHTDTENLKYFVDKNGIRCIYDRVVAYAMQGENIVKLFYDLKSAQLFYIENWHKTFPIIYFFDEKLMIEDLKNEYNS